MWPLGMRVLFVFVGLANIREESISWHRDFIKSLGCTVVGQGIFWEKDFDISGCEKLGALFEDWEVEVLRPDDCSSVYVEREYVHKYAETNIPRLLSMMGIRAKVAKQLEQFNCDFVCFSRPDLWFEFEPGSIDLWHQFNIGTPTLVLPTVGHYKAGYPDFFCFGSKCFVQRFLSVGERLDTLMNANFLRFLVRDGVLNPKLAIMLLLYIFRQRQVFLPFPLHPEILMRLDLEKFGRVKIIELGVACLGRRNGEIKRVNVCGKQPDASLLNGIVKEKISEGVGKENVFKPLSWNLDS